MTDPANPSGGEALELHIPMTIVGRVRDAVHEARKNYEEDSLAEEPDETARHLRALESELNRAVFG